MELKREFFFKKCKDDIDRLLGMIQEAGEVYVSGIVGVVKLKGRSYPVYQYNVGSKEMKVSKKLHEYLVSSGALEREEAHEAQ